MKCYQLWLVAAFLHTCAWANNIEVANISLTGQDTDAGTTQVQFDLSWENSWRISVGPNNWDAAWVFVKYRVNGNLWRHAALNTSGVVAASGSNIDVVSDQTGAFIYRSADGTGDVNWQNIQLQWDYDADNVDDNAVVDVQVFAIEMVYVPEGAFSVGTGFGGDEIDEFFTLIQIGVFFLRRSYEIDSEAAIPVANSVGNLYYDNTVNGGDQLGPIPADFPKGFAAYYCMKYETSQDQWVSFFNTLTQTQKLALDITGPEGKNADDEFFRNAISWPDGGSATTTLPNVPMSYVRAGFVNAYLDWSGLRPMTELEFEKSCRGSLSPIANEFAWGNSNIHNTMYTTVNAGTESEQITDPGSGTGNARMQNTNAEPSGPLRCGIFAASAMLNNREETGGSYYGIMELTGNVYERPVSVGNPEGRAFDGQHGDGTITAGGQSNVPNWPLVTGEGYGYRGAGYPNDEQFLYVSDRNDAANSFFGANGRIGFRGVRTAE